MESNSKRHDHERDHRAFGELEWVCWWWDCERIIDANAWGHGGRAAEFVCWTILHLKWIDFRYNLFCSINKQLASGLVHAIRGQMVKTGMCVFAFVGSQTMVRVWFVLWIATVEMQLIPTGGGFAFRNRNQVNGPKRFRFELQSKQNLISVLCGGGVLCVCVNWHWGCCGLKPKAQTFNYYHYCYISRNDLNGMSDVRIVCLKSEIYLKFSTKEVQKHLKPKVVEKRSPTWIPLYWMPMSIPIQFIHITEFIINFMLSNPVSSEPVGKSQPSIYDFPCFGNGYWFNLNWVAFSHSWNRTQIANVTPLSSQLTGFREMCSMLVSANEQNMLNWMKAPIYFVLNLSYTDSGRRNESDGT